MCRDRTVSKEYLAITVGIPQPPAHEQQSQQAAELQQQGGRHVFSVNAPIDRHQLYDTARCIAPSGKPALTHVEVSNAVCLRVCCLGVGVLCCCGVTECTAASSCLQLSVA